MALPTSSPILRTILTSIRRLYPEKLADRSWDNTGLLLESPPLQNDRSNRALVLLTTDLTTAVATEAINKNATLVLTYHPIIFRPLKSLTFSGGNTQQTTLLRLAQAGISVYSPHTAVDASLGGVNDWLCDGISGGGDKEESRRVIQTVSGLEGTEHEGSGYGRLITLKKEESLDGLISRAKAFLGMDHLSVARSANDSVKTIGVCAGSGGSVFKGVKADLFFTGELSHHEALAAVESGSSVITCFHSNSERGYLKHMKKSLEEEFAKTSGQDKESSGGQIGVEISSEDKDPYQIV